MPFKSETLEEARDRLLAQTEAENEGMEAASEGVLTARRGVPTDPDSIEAAYLEHHQNLRVMPATTDIAEGQPASLNYGGSQPKAAGGRSASKSARKGGSKGKADAAGQAASEDQSSGE